MVNLSLILVSATEQPWCSGGPTWGLSLPGAGLHAPLRQTPAMMVLLSQWLSTLVGPSPEASEHHREVTINSPALLLVGATESPSLYCIDSEF